MKGYRNPEDYFDLFRNSRLLNRVKTREIATIEKKELLAHTWKLTKGTLPAGLILNPSGKITGIPTVEDKSTFTVEVKDTAPKSEPQEFTITVT